MRIFYGGPRMGPIPRHEPTLPYMAMGKWFVSLVTGVIQKEYRMEPIEDEE